MRPRSEEKPLTIASLLSPLALSLALLLLLPSCGGMGAGRRDESRARLALAHKYYRSFSLRKALAEYKTLEGLGIEDGVMYYRMGHITYVLQKDLDARNFYFKKALPLLEEAVAKGGGPLSYYYLGLILEDLGQGREKRDDVFEHALLRHKGEDLGKLSAEELDKLGKMAALRERPGEARELYERAIGKDRAYALPHYNLGQLFLREGKPGEALARFREFLRLEPGDPDGLFGAGQALEGLGQYEEALKSYEEVIKRDPSHSPAKAKLAELREATERKEKILSKREELELGLGFRGSLTPLIFPDDGFRFSADGKGAPSFSPGGDEVLFGAEAEGAFNLHTVRADGTRLKWRARSLEGYSFLSPDRRRLLLSMPGEKGPIPGFLDLVSGEISPVLEGECRGASLSPEGLSLLCLGREGLERVELPSGGAKVLSGRRRIESARFSPDGRRIILREGQAIVILDGGTGKELEVLESLSGEALAHPHLSPGGRWVISGSNGLFLTSVEEKTSIPLGHPTLSGARFPSFSPDGEKVLFVKGDGIYTLKLPEALGAYFRLMRAQAMLAGEGAGAALGYLNKWLGSLDGYPAYYLLLGRSYTELRFYEKAEESLLRANRMAPSWAEPPLVLGKLAFARGQFDRALSFFERAWELNEKDPRAYLQLGRTLEVTGQGKRALSILEEGLLRFKEWIWREGEVADELRLGILEIYVGRGKVEDALLKLIDWRGSLGARALQALRESPAFEALRQDRRFEEIIGHSPAPEGLKAGPAFRPYEAMVYIDSNPNPIRARVVAEGEGFVTIEAFGVRERYPLSRVRINPLSPGR